jgi:uncharacterized protein (TIGR02147 family)
LVRKNVTGANAAATLLELQEKLAEELATVQSVSQGLRVIYEMYRARDKKYSQQWLAQRASFSSKGHLADVMSGRRPIRLLQLQALLECLSISGINCNLMKTLFELSRCKKANERIELENKLLELRKIVRTYRLTMPLESSANHILVLDVFSAFWLFDGAPSTDKLKAHFKRKYTGPEVDHALKFLLASGAIEFNEQSWRAAKERVTFVAAGDDAPVKFIQSALSDAAKEVPFWFSKSALSHFETVSISTTKSKYELALKAFKDELMMWQSRFESDDADMLIRFNMQLYPIE